VAEQETKRAAVKLSKKRIAVDRSIGVLPIDSVKLSARRP
jgi:hypothetical protein